MRCRSCNSPMVGAVRYKDIQIHGMYVEEDFCNQCIHESDYIDFVDVHSYQFEVLTEDIFTSLGIEKVDDIY